MNVPASRTHSGKGPPTLRELHNINKSGAKARFLHEPDFRLVPESEQSICSRTDFVGPVHQPGGCPFQIPLMCLGTMLGNGGSAVGHVAAGMAGHDACRGDSPFRQFTTNSIVRNHTSISRNPSLRT